MHLPPILTRSVILLFILVSFFAIYTNYAHAQAISPASISLQDGWEYRWGDPAISNQTIESWLKEDSTEWKAHHDFPGRVPRNNDEKNLWMRVRLPDIIPEQPTLHLQGVDQNLEIYLDQQLIYRFGEIDEQGNGVFSGYPWHIVPLPEHAAGKLLYFRIWADHISIGIFGNAHIGKGQHFVSTMVKHNLGSIIVAIILLFIGIIGVFIGIGGRKKEYAFFALTSISAGIYIFGRSQIKQMILNEPLTWTFIEFASLFICAPSLVGLMATILGTKTWRIVWLGFWISVSYAVFAILAVIFDLVPLFSTLLPFQLIVLIVIPILLACIIKNITSGSKEARFLILAIGCFVLASSADVLISTGVLLTHLQGVGIPVFFPWGNLVMILVIGGILIARAIDMFKKLVISEKTISILNTNLEKNIVHLKELDRLKDEFLSNTSHELRTPLNGIIGIADSLVAGASGAISDGMRKNLGLIIYSGRRLVNLVNDILDFSKLRHHDLQVSLKPLNLNSMIELVFAMSFPLVGKKNLELINDVPVDFPPVLADENRLQQILSNLIGNGIKFTPEGSVRIQAIQVDETIRIAVIDTGIGIAADKLDVIFESFQQGDGSIAREYGGTGLGLAITKNLVEAHGGSIGVDSKPGQGSIFWFQLAKGEIPEGSIHEQIRMGLEVESLSMHLIEAPSSRDSVDTKTSTLVTSDSSASSARARILAVDDESVNLQVLSNYLNLAGFEVVVESDPIVALQHFTDSIKAPFDLVLLDVMMPGMTGFEVCSKIRQRFNGTDLPIILLTAKNQVADLVTGFERGANDYLVKPFSRSELLARIDNHISLKILSQEMALSREIQAKVDKDLEAAHAVQLHLLPVNIDVPGIELAVHYVSADQTGGDWYAGFHDSVCNRAYFFVGDVTGHGVPAALITGLAAGAISSFFTKMERVIGEEMGIVLERIAAVVNAVVHDSGARSGYYMTMAMIGVDLKSGCGVFINAGHNPPLHKNGEECKPLMLRGNPLGMKREIITKTKEFQMEPGDTLLLYTDGLIENTGHDDKSLHSKEIRQLLLIHGESAIELRDALVDATRTTWSDKKLDDDCTIFVVRWNPN